MRCYKVVRRNEKKELVSIIVPEGAAQIQYIPDRKVTANPILSTLGNGILVFENVEDAKDFAEKWNGEVWLAEGEDKFDNLPRFADPLKLTGNTLQVAIRSRKASNEQRSFPWKTVMVRALTLKKCLKHYNGRVRR
jgi:hypothetical protein